MPKRIYKSVWCNYITDEMVVKPKNGIQPRI